MRGMRGRERKKDRKKKEKEWQNKVKQKKGG
jgi:hypothetical protein